MTLKEVGTKVVMTVLWFCMRDVIVSVVEEVARKTETERLADGEGEGDWAATSHRAESRPNVVRASSLIVGQGQGVARESRTRRGDHHSNSQASFANLFRSALRT